MSILSELPLRQKILLSVTILTGLFIVFAYYEILFSQESLNMFILFYGICVPMFLLSMDTLIDLDNKKIFSIWTIVAIIFLFVFYITKGNPELIIHRSSKFNPNGINKYLSDSCTTPLKALPTFLIFYLFFNSIVKAKTGNFIVNTFRQNDMYNDIAKRKIYWYDILTTFTLLGIIIFVSLFEFKN